MIVRAGAAQDPKGKLGLAMLTASLLDQGAGNRTAEQIADAIDFVGGILGTGAGTDLTYVNTVVMKDSLALGAAADGRRRAPADVCAGRDRAAAPAGDVVAEGGGRGSRQRRQPGDRSADLRLPSVRPARQRHRRIAGVAHAPGLRRLPSAVLRAEQRAARHRRRRQRRRGDGRRAEGVRRLGAARRAGVQADRSAAADQARRRHRQARRGADRDSRRAARHSAQARRLSRDGSGGEDSRRRGRQPAAAGAALAARPHLRRVGRPRHLQDRRRHRRRDRHAHRARPPKRCASIVDEFLQAAARARLRRRARRRAGLPGRALPADDRNARRDRDAGAQPAVLRAAARGAADLSRARAAGHARRHPARGAGYFKPDRLSVVLVGDAERVHQRARRASGFGEFERIPIEQVDLLAADLRKGGRACRTEPRSPSPADACA